MRRHWEENRRVHQLNAICPLFDRMENIYCAMQLCGQRVGLIAEAARQLSFDVT